MKCAFRFWFCLYTLYLTAILKPIAACILRRQIGQKSKGLRSDSSRWFEPCMTQFNHWQCLIPNMWPISWVIVYKEIFDMRIFWWLKGQQYSLRPTFNVWRNMFEGNLAGAQQQDASDGGSVISVKNRVVPLLGLNWSPEPPSITSAVEVVIVPGKAENTHSCSHHSQHTLLEIQAMKSPLRKT